MTDVGTEFLHGISAFGATRLGHASETTFKDSGIADHLARRQHPEQHQGAFEQLKADIEADVELSNRSSKRSRNRPN